MTVNNKRVFYVKYLAHQIYADILKARPDVRLDRLENESPDAEVSPILSAAHAYQVGAARDELAKHFHVDQDLLRAAIAGSSARPSAVLRAKLPPSLDSTIVTKLEAIMPPSAIRELYTVYVADTRHRIDELERYSADGDEDSLRRCAHALKGAAAMAGVSGIASIADGLEAGRLPRQDHVRLFHQLRSACDDVEQTMIKSAATNSAASGEAR